MIQPVPASPMTATASLALPGEAALASGVEVAEALDFSALLALEGTPGEVIGAAAPAVVMPEAAGQVLAGEAAVPGKILPPSLPEAATDDAQPDNTEPAAEPAIEPVVTALVATALPLSLPQPAAMTVPQEPADPSTQRPVPAASVQAAAAALVQQLRPPQPEQTTPAAVPKVGDALAEAPADERPVPAAGNARKAATMPVPAEEVRLDLGRLVPLGPRTGLRLPGETALAQAPSMEATTSPAAQPASANLAPQIALSAAQPGQAPVRPKDFSALIDRLTAAREAMAPHSVAITVAHQDFGPVRLRFRSEDTGLSVAITSADPGFARAAAAAPLPVLPASASDQAGFTPQRGDGGQAQTGGSGNPGGSGRGSTPDRRDDQPQPRHQLPREHRADRADARRGIFA